MRILHVIDSSGMYGAEIMLLNLMTEQKAMGLSPVLLSLGSLEEQEKPLERECLARGLPVHRLRVAGNYHLMRNITTLLQVVAELDVDIVHSHGYKGNILFGAIPGWKRTFPMVCTLHGWTATRRFSRMWWYEKLDRFCIQRFDAVVLVTRGSYGRCTTIQYGPAAEPGKKIFLVENGIPELSFDDSGQPEMLDPLLDDDRFLIGAIGRLSPEKGFGSLIDALYWLNRDDGAYRLMILGEGGERQYLEGKVSEYGLEGSVALPGYRDNAYRWLKKFDVFVMPSLTEGLPITLLEAMQAEVPVIASRVGGIPEIIEHGQTGMLIEPMDTTALAEAIQCIRNRPAKGREIARRARQVALQRFSSRRMAEEYGQVYTLVSAGLKR